MPPRRVSSVDVVSINQKLESLKNEGINSNKRRRTTVTSVCPIYKSNHFNRGESIDETDDVDDNGDDDGKVVINGDASLIGMDEESLAELVELTQKMESTL